MWNREGERRVKKVPGNAEREMEDAERTTGDAGLNWGHGENGGAEEGTTTYKRRRGGESKEEQE